jgi:hypothetical protein
MVGQVSRTSELNTEIAAIARTGNQFATDSRKVVRDEP